MEINQPVTEDPNIVTGSPVEQVNTPAPTVSGDPQQQELPLYRGLTGDIKSQDDLKSYTKSLEDIVVQQKAAQHIQQSQNPTTPAVPVVIPPKAKERFSELIFSKPEEAFEIAVQEAQTRMQTERDAERRKEQFWSRFYEKNQDLRKMDRIVQSIVREQTQAISVLKTETEVADFLSRESRKIIDLVKKETGFVETVVPSQSAVMLGGSGELVPAAPKAPTAPINFADQIRRLKPNKRK